MVLSNVIVDITISQVVETSVNVITNSPSQDYTHPDDHNLPTYDVTPLGSNQKLIRSGNEHKT